MGTLEQKVTAAPDANGTQNAIQALLMNLCCQCAPPSDSPATPVDRALNLLCDCAALSRAQEALSSQSQNKSLDVVFRSHISAMVGVLNLFLDPDLPYTWRKASMIVVKAQGGGSNRARSIRAWILDFVQEGMLPLHSYGYTRKTVFENEEVLQEVQRELSERAKVRFVKAEDICDIVASEKLRTLFIQLGI